MEPLISMTILNPRPVHHPGELLEGEVQIDAVGERVIRSIETTVLWFTEGKGDEDIGVHFFESRQQEDFPDIDLRELHRFSTLLPQSPLSYDGKIVKIRWCVRTRVFLRDGRQALFEEAFVLGDVQSDWSGNLQAETKETETSESADVTETQPPAEAASESSGPLLNGHPTDGSTTINASS